MQGTCRGEGLALALGCDLRLAEGSASFQTGLESLGGGPNIEAVWLVNLVGLAGALEILTGKTAVLILVLACDAVGNTTAGTDIAVAIVIKVDKPLDDD